MDIQRVEQIAGLITIKGIATGREANNLGRWLWEDVLGKQQGSQGSLTQQEVDTLESALLRLQAGEPVQYIAGHAWFYGKPFFVNRDVLIPRPETEELVEWVIETCRQEKRSLSILDIGTGSGCIAITLQWLLGEQVKVLGIDVSPGALAVAMRNNEAFGTDVRFLQHDFLDNGFTGLGEFDMIVSNPPYISREMAGEAIVSGLRYEPDVALYPAGNDPDVFYKKIILEAGSALREGGYCFMEINEFRKGKLNDLLCQSTQWAGMQFKKDLQGNWRMLRIRR